MTEQKIVVCAYHTVGYRCLEELLSMGAKVEMVFSHEDSSSERIWFKSVRELAERNRIPYTTSSVNLPENLEIIKKIKPALFFSFYYRHMITREVLDIPVLGALNMHGSYLPKYRGRVPVNWAVINGEKETGATLHYMVEKPDAGDIVAQEKIPIAFTDTALDVFYKVADAAAKIIARSYPLLIQGKAPRVPMDLSKGSYFGGRRPADGLINWEKSAVEIYNLIRGVTHPYPGAFTYLNGKKIFIWKAWPVEGNALPGKIVSAHPLLVGTGEGLIEIRSLQAEGDMEKSSEGFVSDAEMKDRCFDHHERQEQSI